MLRSLPAERPDDRRLDLDGAARRPVRAAQRQRVTADNIANVQTPGFLAGRVDFESTLQRTISNGQTPAVGRVPSPARWSPTNTNGNNVNLDTETVIATETGLRYQLALNALDGKYACCAPR